MGTWYGAGLKIEREVEEVSEGVFGFFVLVKGTFWGGGVCSWHPLSMLLGKRYVLTLFAVR